jgi:hypothetical protein
VRLRARKRQAGITAVGFLLLAVLVGVVGLAGIKLTPMYIKNMQLGKILEDVQGGVRGDAVTPAGIRAELDKRLNIESIQLPRESVKIAQSKNGYSLRIQYESRAPYIAGIILLIEFDRQVEISK